MRLADRHCSRCTPETPTLSDSEAREQLGQLEGWELVERDGRRHLTRTLRFKGFAPGVDLVNRIAAIAEAEGHHPDLHLTYGALTVDLTTHAAGGLTENDFILAAKIDEDQRANS
ncbi:MAG TPA: 4a-hydroxytetrahydrobiopterin dehydratase [Candidatus Dormibacteraeota bacterium]|nr:4a-hydroxytetrahydrobiopterin dehydratase [Candidatus Dormibacteraeota bacterium]